MSERRLRRARRIYTAGAVVNFAVTIPAFVAYNWYVDQFTSARPNYPFLVWIWSGMAFLWGVSFLEIARDPLRAYPLVKYSWLEKSITSASVITAYVIGDVPGRFAIAICITDVVWIPLFLWVHADLAAERDRAAKGGQLHFKERMAGHLMIEDLNDMIAPNADGTGWTKVALYMDMAIGDVESFWRGDHIGDITSGVVACDALGGQLPISDGHFQLMVPATDGRHQHMNYLIHFTDSKENRFTLHGYKEVVPGAFSAWEETTTTLLTLDRSWVSTFSSGAANPAGGGVLRIRFLDVLWQQFTFRANPDASILTRLHTRASFITKFLLSLWRVFVVHRTPPLTPAE